MRVEEVRLTPNAVRLPGLILAGCDVQGGAAWLGGIIDRLTFARPE